MANQTTFAALGDATEITAQLTAVEVKEMLFGIFALPWGGYRVDNDFQTFVAVLADLCSIDTLWIDGSKDVLGETLPESELAQVPNFIVHSGVNCTRVTCHINVNPNPEGGHLIDIDLVGARVARGDTTAEESLYHYIISTAGAPDQMYKIWTFSRQGDGTQVARYHEITQ